MAALNSAKKITVYDYPEHLNPFYEDDNHTKIRFWTLNRSSFRRGSISLSSFKDLRNTWTLKSFMKKGKKNKEEVDLNNTYPQSGPRHDAEGSPIQYRRALQYSSASVSQPRATYQGPDHNRYEYGGSITPLPRSRFQERMRSTSQMEVNQISNGSPGRASFSPNGAPYARSETTGSRQSIESTNPFDEAAPIRATRRKKKRAPLPPSVNGGVPKSQTTNGISTKTINENEILPKDDFVALDDPQLSIVLQIVEDDDRKVEDAISSLDKKQKDCDEARQTKEEIETRQTKEESEARQPKEESGKIKTDINGNEKTVDKDLIEQKKSPNVSSKMDVVDDEAKEVKVERIVTTAEISKEMIRKNKSDNNSNYDVKIIRLRNDHDKGVKIEEEVNEIKEETVHKEKKVHKEAQKVPPIDHYANGDIRIIRLRDDYDDEKHEEVSKENFKEVSEVTENVPTKESQMNGDAQVINHKDDHIIEPCENAVKTKDDTNNNEIIFKKVDINQYRRNSSCNGDISRNDKEKTVKFSNKRSVSMTNNFSTFDVQLHIDEDVDDTDNNTSQPQKVICKVYNNEPSRKHSIDASISSTEREFMEIDKTTKELEMEIQKLNTHMNNSENNVKKAGTNVSAIRKIFDNGNNLNPIPKPRRTKISSSLRLRK